MCEFQFLIGWLQTISTIEKEGEKCLLVSIPYRLATNKYEGRRYDFIRLVFQFLIGWLQTNWIELHFRIYFFVSIPYRLATNLLLFNNNINNSDMFQFLIGWLQTFCPAENLTNVKLFQFLIGWLQTLNYLLAL